MEIFKQFLVSVSVLIAVLTYMLLIKGLLKEKMEQSFATWALWTLLDVIAALSIIFQHGNWALVSLYVLGGLTISSILLYKKQFSWTWFETMIASLVAICLVVWYFSGSWMATIASTTAVLISSAPQFVASWKNPAQAGSPIVWGGYTLANILAFFGGKNWSIEERFYPGVCVVLCATLTVLALRKPGIKTGAVITKTAPSPTTAP